MKTNIELIEHAAFLLDNEALTLRERHNLDHRNPDWQSEAEAKAEHDDMKNTATKLYALATSMRAAQEHLQYGTSVLTAFDRMDRESVRERLDKRAAVERTAKDRL